MIFLKKRTILLKFTWGLLTAFLVYLLTGLFSYSPAFSQQPRNADFSSDCLPVGLGTLRTELVTEVTDGSIQYRLFDAYLQGDAVPFSVLISLQFMKSPQDSVMAGEIGQVINRNASSGNGKSDEFFSKAGDLLAKALLQLVKGSKYPDMAMLYAILRLPSLVKRIDYAVQSRQIKDAKAVGVLRESRRELF